MAQDNEEDPITIDEITSIAKRKLPKNVYEYYACGSDDEQALRRNINEFDRLERLLVAFVSSLC